MLERPTPPSGPRGWRRRDVLRLAAALPVSSPGPLLAHGEAAGTELRILTGAPGTASSEIVAALAHRFPAAPASDDLHGLVARGGPGTYLAIGPSALETVLNADVPGNVVSAFVSSIAYQRLRAAAAPQRARLVTAIYAEASPAAQMKLVRRLYRRRVTVGVLLSPTSRGLQPLIERAATAVDLGVAFAEARPGDNPVRELAALTSASVLLAVPDPNLYNAQVARAILESTYRRQQGVIGYSRAMVSAGMLGAAYATLDDVVAHLADMLDAIAAGPMPEPQYPRYWRVAINETVARSLDVVVDASARDLGNLPG